MSWMIYWRFARRRRETFYSIDDHEIVVLDEDVLNLVLKGKKNTTMESCCFAYEHWSKYNVKSCGCEGLTSGVSNDDVSCCCSVATN